MTRLSAASDGRGGITRNRRIVAANTALLIIDVQHYCAFPGEGEWEHIDSNHIPPEHTYYFDRIEEHVLPNIRKMQACCRKAGIEVMYTVIESLTADGRERGLDYKISGFLVPKGSPWARVPEAIAPLPDEIILPKGSSSVFVSTNIDYILRALEIDYLVLAGLVTDQCVESAVRDACDHGFLVTLLTDVCGTHSQQRQDASLNAIKGYCRHLKTSVFSAFLPERGVQTAGRLVPAVSGFLSAVYGRPQRPNRFAASGLPSADGLPA